MFDSDLELDIDQELSEIPPEYQETFRQAMANELADSDQNRTDTDILHYLRSRRDDFKRGGFIRPDGRPGLVTLTPEALYEQALPQLAQSSLGEADDIVERRRTFIKIGVFLGLAALLLVFAMRGRAARADNAESDGGTPVAEALAAAGTVTPTPSLPEITGVDDSLQTIGGLGGALTIGRPSAIELHYASNDTDGRSEETIALAIDPSQPTPKGEMRFNEATMLSDNPVAVWLFGTVLNYSLGIPDSLVRNLESGDQITLSTNTGATLHFVVAETGQGSNYDAGRLLSQNRLGLTLFALPAVAEEDVSYALAHYDVASEEGQGQEVYELGDTVALRDGETVQVKAVQSDNLVDGSFRIVVHGEAYTGTNTDAILLSLAAANEQTTAIPVEIAEDGTWQLTFTLPNAVAGQGLLAELRALPGNSLAVVRLGDVPNLTEQLAVTVTDAWRDAANEQAVVTVSIHNPGEGAVYLSSDFIQLPNEGGDADALPWQITPRLPLLIHPGETRGITVSFLPPTLPVQMQIGTDLWEVSALPNQPTDR